MTAPLSRPALPGPRSRTSSQGRAEASTQLSSATVHRFSSNEPAKADATDPFAMSPAHQRAHALWMRTHEAPRAAANAPRVEEPTINPLRRFATMVFRATTNQRVEVSSNASVRAPSLWLPANARTPEFSPLSTPRELKQAGSMASRTSSSSSSSSSGQSMLPVSPEAQQPLARLRQQPNDAAFRAMWLNTSAPAEPSNLGLARNATTFRQEPYRLKLLRLQAMESQRSVAEPRRSQWTEQEGRLADAVRRIDAMPARVARGEAVDVGEFAPLLEEAAKTTQG